MKSDNSAFLHILSTEGRGVGLCWEHSKPKGPKGPKKPAAAKLCTGELNAIRKHKCFLCLREGRVVGPCWEKLKPKGPTCAGGPDVIRKKAWSFYRTISGARLCWELGEPKVPEGVQRT